MPGSYEIRFGRGVIRHLDWIDRRFHGDIQDSIGRGLRNEPVVRTRDRKPLEQPCVFENGWELRCGAKNRFRVFYEVDEAEHAVWILAIGEKIGDQLYINGEKVTL